MKRFLLIVLLIIANQLTAQKDSPLKVKFDEKGDRYVKGSFTAQLWGRFTELNTGTTIKGLEKNTYTDFSIRRIRATIMSSPAKNVYIYTSFGGNNINHRTTKSFRMKVLDLYAQYTFADAFTLGAGKSGHQGLSRLDSRSCCSLLTLDAPIFALNTINAIDDEGRNLGVFVKGQIGKIDYRFSAFHTDKYSKNVPLGYIDFAQNNSNLKYTGYLKYQFFEKESNKSAYHKGTYLGTKKILNLGLGFTHLKDAMVLTTGNKTSNYNMNHWATDIFLDLPLKKDHNTAITAYLGYFNYDFGPDYIRNIGANNPADGNNNNSIFNGSGNAFPMIGTGSTVFFQLGYLSPNTIFKNSKIQLQPNIAVQYSDYDKLGDPMWVMDAGVNCYFKGQKSKLSLGFQNRPEFVWGNNEIGENSRKNMVVLQYQFSIN
ncbi:MAG: porin [Flavobacteriales bacterium]|nr:MAG: porin [Flavobacteriales bacterium]